MDRQPPPLWYTALLTFSSLPLWWMSFFSLKNLIVDKKLNKSTQLIPKINTSWVIFSGTILKDSSHTSFKHDVPFCNSLKKNLELQMGIFKDVIIICPVTLLLKHNSYNKKWKSVMKTSGSLMDRWRLCCTYTQGKAIGHHREGNAVNWGSTARRESALSKISQSWKGKACTVLYIHGIQYHLFIKGENAKLVTRG